VGDRFFEVCILCRVGSGFGEVETEVDTEVKVGRQEDGQAFIDDFYRGSLLNFVEERVDDADDISVEVNVGHTHKVSRRVMD
jgi:hypothetical protein